MLHGNLFIVVSCWIHSIYDSNYELSIFISLFNCNINLYLISFTEFQKYLVRYMQLRFEREWINLVEVAQSINNWNNCFLSAMSNKKNCLVIKCAFWLKKFCSSVEIGKSIIIFCIFNINTVRAQFLCGPIMMLGSHMKDPSQYDL